MRKVTSTHAFLAVLAISSIVSTVKAEESAVEVTVGADIVSSYIWRGTDCGDAAVQPALGVSYKGLSLSAWGSVGIVNPEDTKELDFTLSYTLGGLTIGVTDYWFSGGKEYFEYKKDKTSHVFEANAAFDFGAFAVAWNTNFYGNDAIKEDGEKAYSTYIEVGAPFTLGGLDWSAAVGGTPWEGAYAPEAAITNISLGATKEIKFSDSFSLPLTATVIANPSKTSQAMYFVVSASF